MSAIIQAVYDLAKGQFRNECRVTSDSSPAYIPYNDETPGISDIIKNLLDELQELYDYDINNWKYYKIFEPTEEQCKIFNNYFKSGRCYFSTTSPSTCNPRRLVWNWSVKLDDLNLRTKIGREERDMRTKHIQEEAKILLNRIRNLFTPEFTSLIIAQEKHQRLEYDRLIPTGKKNAIEISIEEYNQILKKMDRVRYSIGHFTSDVIKLKVWKTLSDVQHYELIKES
jgi:hypothetical protein